MRITKEELTRDITALGLQKGDTVLVHSSMKSLGGEVDGGTAAVIGAFLTALGPDGTLMMPALSYETVTREHPYFSVRRTPSCVGKLTEAFRLTPGVLRSVHPTHSICACGRHAEELTGGHILDRTPVGPHSPLRRMMAYGGKILMLGCGLAHNTFMHGVEQEAGAPYCLAPDTIDFTLELADGKEITAAHIPHAFVGVDQHYERAASLLDGRELRQGKIAAADCYLMDSNALWKKGLATIQKSPLYFIDYRK